MWNCRLYYKTHLNTINTLDKGALLEQAEHRDFEPLDVIDAASLQTISIRATRAQVKDVEYVKLTDTETGDFFYYEAGIPTPTSVDVWSIPLTVDGVLTMGEMYHGVENIPFLDGIITRHHVAKANDDYGAYTEYDPFLIPSKELEMEVVKLFDDADDEKNVVVESTIALDTQANNYQAKVYTDPNTGEEVTVPTVVAAPQNSTVTFGASSPTYETAGTEYFDGNNETVQRGIGQVRSLGVESGILNSYVLPSSQAAMLPTQTGQIVAIQGVRDEANSTMNFEYATVENKRVLYGALNSISLVSVANGMSMSFKPEDIKAGETGVAPTVVKLTDPRPNGRPYFMFQYFKGENNEYGLRNAVAGMEWANAPLVYTGKSGSTLDQINFSTSLRLANINQGELEYQNGMTPIKAVAGQSSGMTGVLSAMAPQTDHSSQYRAIQNMEMAAMQSRHAYENWNMAKDGDKWFVQQLSHEKERARANLINAWDNMDATMNASRPSGAALGMIANGVGYVSNIAMSTVDYFHNKELLKEMYGARMANERAQFATGQIVAPQLNFPRSETLRDFIGNGVFVIRYRPNATDIQKLDRILTMYGYKDTLPLIGGESVFSNRSKFNFVQIQGCSIGGDAPRWLREATAALLSVGVRIWHQIPDKTAYNAGQNV